MKVGILWAMVLDVLLWVPLFGALQGPPRRVTTPQAAPTPQAPVSPQAPAAPLTPATPQAANSPATPMPSAGKRRDPFHSLIETKKPGDAATHLPPPGQKGLVIGQLELQGIVRGLNNSWIAVVDNKTKRAYFLHEKDQLYDGAVTKITADSIVFLERSTDPLGKPVTREVVKKLAKE